MLTAKVGASQNRRSRHGAESAVVEGNSAEPQKEREWGSEPLLGNKKEGVEQSPECQREREGVGGGGGGGAGGRGRRPALRAGHVLNWQERVAKLQKLPV